MPITQIPVQRFSVVTRNPFESVVAKLVATIGHPDMSKFPRDVTTSKTFAELEQVIHRAIGPSGLMEFARFNIGEILRACGLGFGDTVKFTIMLADMGRWAEFNAVYLTYFDPGRLPARSAFGANGLALGGEVEIECVAYWPRER